MEIEHLAIAGLRGRMIAQTDALAVLTDAVLAGKMDTYAAADELVEIFGGIKP